MAATTTEPRNLSEVYREVCGAYERIDDFRAKLLGLLPVASAAGLLVLLNEAGELQARESQRTTQLIGGHGLLVLVGIIGAIFTLGLFIYELRGIQYCVRLIRIGEQLEEKMVHEGRFRKWPEDKVWKFGNRVTEPAASGLIYSSILAAWIFVAVMSASWMTAAILALTIGLSCLLVAWKFFRAVQEIEKQKALTMTFETKRIPARRDGIAPDGSDVRLLLQVRGGGLAHFELAEGEVSVAVRHQTIEEVWLFVGGHGEMWRRRGTRQDVTQVEPDVCLTIPVGTEFQFRSSGPGPLQAIAATMPPWPGPGEAVPVEGKWEATVRPGLPMMT